MAAFKITLAHFFFYSRSFTFVITLCHHIVSCHCHMLVVFVLVSSVQQLVIDDRCVV